MRILMPCAAFPPVVDGGGPISSLMMAKLLIAAGHEVLVVHVGDEDRHEIYEDVPVHRIKPLNIYWNYYEPRPAWQKAIWHLLENGNPRAFLRMREEIAQFEPDLVLTVSIENINVATWAAARAAAVPVAHMVFSAFMMCWNGVMQKNGENCTGQCNFCRMTSIGRRLLSRLVNSVFGESHDILRRHMAEGYFPNATPYRVPASIDRLVATAPRVFPQDRPFRVGFLGVHTRFKGFGVLAETARMLADDPSVEFLIGGVGRDDYATDTAASYPASNTRFLGWIKPDDFFPQVDALVYPTIGREAFGRASIEAFAHAAPVISTSIGGVAENVSDGVNGYHVEPENPQMLRDLILRMARDARAYEALSQGALIAGQSYLWPIVGKTLNDALEETLARHRTGQAFSSPSQGVTDSPSPRLDDQKDKQNEDAQRRATSP